MRNCLLLLFAWFALAVQASPVSDMLERIDRELARMAAERIREASEQERQRQEGIRQQQETQRVDAEVSRASEFAELKQLKELLDAGIITEEEFSIKKRQVLHI